jgi:hypothetical protein
MKRLFLLMITLIYSTGLMAQNGVIRGRVFDAGTNEGLPFVNIIVVGTDFGAASDLEGYFLITGMQPGFYKLMASFIGYETTYSQEIQVNNARPASIDIAMKQSALSFESVTVKPSTFIKLEEAPLSVVEIRLSEIETIPGGNRDLSKIIQSFPGVGSTPAFRNDVIVRGGGSNESRFYIDGIEIPNLNHFATQGASGGAVGIINPDFIQSVNYYSGAFPANRGNALSGVFEFRQKNGNEERFNWRAVVGASDLALTTDGPISEKTDLIFSVRRSYLQFLFDVIGLPFLPTYNDYQFKSRTRFNDKNSLTIVSIGALDEFTLNTGLENPDEQQRYIITYLPINEQWNYTTGFNYTHFAGKSFQNYIFSRNMLNNSSYKYPENDESRPRSLDYLSREIENKFRFENTWRDKGWKVNFGLDAQYAKYENTTKQQIFRDSLFTVNYDTFLELYSGGIFGQVSQSFLNELLTLSFGMRADANNYSESMQNPINQISPRFSASYKISDKLNLNLNTGRYFQRPSYTSLGYKENNVYVNKNNNLKYIAANHYIAGFDYQINSDSKVTMEGFIKDYSNYPFSVRDSISLANKGADFGTIGDEEVLSIGKGRARGAEFLLRYTPENSPLNIIASYTYVRSEFQNLSDEWIPSAWDSKHLFTLTTTTAFGKNDNWRGGFKWRYVGGLPYTPYDLERSAIKAAWDTQGLPFFDFSRFNEERFAGFHQLDLRIDRTFVMKRFNLNLYFDVQNLYNFQAAQPDIVLRELGDNGSPIIETGADSIDRYRLYSIENTTGTVLPTIGIIFDF